MTTRRFQAAPCAALLFTVVLGGAPVSAAEAEFTLGQSLSLSGPSKHAGQALLNGREACVNLVNHKGGAGGYKFRLATLDDGGDPEHAATNARTLVERERAQLLLGSMGPTVHRAVEAWAQGRQIAIVAPFGGDVESRTAQHVFPVTANQSAEAARLAAHLQATGMGAPVIVASTDRAGRSALLAFEEALAVTGNAHRGLFDVQADGTNARTAVRQALSMHATVILLATTGAATIEVLRALTSEHAPALLQVYGMSSAASQGDLAVQGGAMRAFAMTQVLPSPGDQRSPLAATFREAMGGRASTLSHIELEGCLSVLATAEVLKRRGVEGIRAGVLQAFRSAGTINVGGLEIDLRDKVNGTRFTDIVYVHADGRVSR